jgi:hypothetical protein
MGKELEKELARFGVTCGHEPVISIFPNLPSLIRLL